MITNQLDRLFQVVFARYRRKDSNIESAWKQAIRKVFSYISWAVSGIGGLLLVSFYSIVKIGASEEQRQAFLLAALVVAVTIHSLLKRRYRTYMLSPLSIPSEESHDDKMFVLYFHTVSFGIFVLACLAVFFLLR